MPIFIKGNINQGDDCFDVDSRGKQCAFNSLLGLLTAYKKPVSQWSATTLNNILLQGNKLYLKAKNSHLIRLPPGVVYLSVSDLPKLVTVILYHVLKMSSFSIFVVQLSKIVICLLEQTALNYKLWSVILNSLMQQVILYYPLWSVILNHPLWWVLSYWPTWT